MMRIMGRLACALMLVLPWGAAWAAGVHHDLEVTLDPAIRRLVVTDRLTLPAGPHRLFLAPGLAVDSLSLDGRPWPFRRAEDSLALTLPEGAGVLTLRYGGTLPALEVNRIPAESLAAGGEGAFLSAGSGWVPLTGEEPPTWRLSVSVPSPFVAVASGALESERRDDDAYHATFGETQAVEAPSLFVGPWAVAERMAGPVRLRTYFHPEQAELSDLFLNQAARTLAGFSERIGAYPFAGFAVVSVPLPVGYAYPGLTTIGRRILPLPFVRDQSLGHEILHNWWGNGVRVGSGGNWAEGLTTYMADHAAAVERGEDAGLRLDWLRDYAALPPERDGPLAAFRGRTHDASQVIGYGKAALVFHMLRDEIGETAWQAGIRRFWDERRFQDAGWDDVRRAFEAASGQDLAAFFSQWLERTGAPVLTLDVGAATATSITLTLRQTAPVYAVTVPVVVETVLGPERHRVPLTADRTTVTLTAVARPLAVAVDPDHTLFRRLSPGEAPPTLRDITLDPTAAVVVAGEGAGERAGRALAERLMDGQPRLVSPDQFRGETPLAVIGTAAGVDAVLQRLNLGSPPREVAGQGTAQVWTLRRETGRAVLVVRGANADALEALQRPLPHHGRQGWLVFDGARAVSRGGWPAGISPLYQRVGKSG